jgi:hypothetical protein
MATNMVSPKPDHLADLQDDVTEREGFACSIFPSRDLLPLVLGLVLAATSLWLWIEKQETFPTAWKWTTICSCVLLGRIVTQCLISAAVYVLENFLPLDTLAYFVHELINPLKDFMWFTAVSVTSWVLLNEHEVNIDGAFEKALLLVGLVLFSRVLSLLSVKMITAKLHAVTFWEQLQATVKHEVTRFFKPYFSSIKNIYKH